MTIRTACFAAGAVALALPAFAGQPKNLVPGKMAGQQAFPTEAASYTIVNGRMVLTSDWVQLSGRPNTRNIFTCAWDSAEPDLAGGLLGGPTDNVTGVIDGCENWSTDPNLNVPEGSRWYLDDGVAPVDYNNPYITGDILNATPGAAAEGVVIAWYIYVGALNPDLTGADANQDGICDPIPDGFPDSDFWLAIQTYNDGDVNTCVTPTAGGFINGVIYHFACAAWNPGFYQYAAIELNGSGLNHGMPATGAGSYDVIFGVAFDPVTGIITLPGGYDGATQTGVAVQPMLWGAGADEPSGNDGRCGDQDAGQYDDDAPTDGAHTANECYGYIFGVCPEPLGVCLGFFVKDNPNPCPCPGDINGDGIRDINDLTLFLSAFGLPATNCADINGDGVVDINDLTLFLSNFGVPC